MQIKSLTLPALVTLSWVALPAAGQAQLNENLFFREGREQFEAEIQTLQQAQPQGPVLTISDGELRWQPIVSESGGFSVWVPQGQLSDEREVVELESATLTFRVLASETSFGRFVVAYADIPSDLDISSLMPEFKEALVESQDLPLVGTEPVTTETYSGTELRFVGENTTALARLLTGNQRVYVVGVKQPLADGESDAALGFLGSFQLVDIPSDE